MKLYCFSSVPLLLLPLTSPAICAPSPSSTLQDRAATFSGYLISTFSDANPAVQFHLSNGNDPGSYSFSNRGQPVLTSAVGTKGVRDIFLTTNAARNEWFIIATDLDVNAAGFNWDVATRRGSRGLVIWKSTNLLDWSSSKLVNVETSTAGMTWAPSAVWDVSTSQYYVFWSSRHYAASDPNHTGPASLDRIRYATTRDFTTFSAPADYLSLPTTPLIDQEFLALGQPGHFVRFLKNETVNQVYQETTTGGLFGTWTRTPGYVRPESPREGPASFLDNLNPGLAYLFLDDYTQYVPYQTSKVGTVPNWQSISSATFPKGLKHGSVTPLLASEMAAFAQRFPA